ncbi:MAG: bifunctional diguanylate cyclase/phosphodiesterase [Gammaproteobacteria bacterium]|nr:bifunctional diguanylate cyclase/phosphodiesterase [Gammaproteobacteria bacterium]MBU1732004.1 bifunctional diguanylate cyclase/phosphodiesterase [Gammaproteobacteria bacterium]MBU1894045.1 bifunctional diguanylate cyclase/phosphodiesterase [Gammaproteobacteria bacterium]
MRFLLGTFLPLSFKTYGIAFIVMVTLFFGLASWFTLNKIHSTQIEIERNSQRAASAEVAQALLQLTKELEQVAHALTAWDETRQQLSDPAYYDYWRINRALQGGVVPDFVKSVALYNRQGHPLGTVSPDMPAMVDELSPTRVTKQGGRDFIYLTQPVQDMEVRGQISGYAVLKIDFQPALLSVQRFRYVDSASIVLSLREGETIQSDLDGRVLFNVIPNEEISALLKFMTRYQYQIMFIVLLLSWVFYAALAVLLSKPLLRLSKHIDTLRDGRDGLVLDSLDGRFLVKELEKVRISLNDYQRELESMHTSLDQKNTELWTMAHRDPLTGIFNRRCFDEDWRMLLSVASGHRVAVSVMLFDCDHFKAINDTYGHQAGDQVLKSIAQVLQLTLRSGDRLYRLGGDEFVTMFLDADIRRVEEVAKRCVEAVDQYDFSLLGIKEPIRISIGLAYAEGVHTENLMSLQKQADVAMYFAKRPGHGKIALYSEDMAIDGNALLSNQVTNAVFEAMSSGSCLEMYYQPVVNLDTREIEYYEALVRIRHDQELIMPAEIFPVVEGRRLEAEMDFAIMGKVLEDLRNGRIPLGSGLSVNISGPAIVHPRIGERLAEFEPFLKDYKLVLEITETALITQLQQASANLNLLRAAGFKVALDDFGSGYSSLGYLANMPVDIVKFDITLIHSLEHGDERQGSIVASLATMIRKAGYFIVAEGLENQRMLRNAGRLGFSHGQGHFLGRPSRLA